MIEDIIIWALAIMAIAGEMVIAGMLFQILHELKKLNATTWKDKLMNSVIQAFASPVITQLQGALSGALAPRARRQHETNLCDNNGRK